MAMAARMGMVTAATIMPSGMACLEAEEASGKAVLSAGARPAARVPTEGLTGVSVELAEGKVAKVDGTADAALAPPRPVICVAALSTEAMSGVVEASVLEVVDNSTTVVDINLRWLSAWHPHPRLLFYTHRIGELCVLAAPSPSSLPFRLPRPVFAFAVGALFPAPVV